MGERRGRATGGSRQVADRDESDTTAVIGRSDEAGPEVCMDRWQGDAGDGPSSPPIIMHVCVSAPGAATHRRGGAYGAVSSTSRASCAKSAGFE